VGFLLLLQVATAEGLKPYILALESQLPLDTLHQKVSQALINNGINLVGEYQPASDPKRLVQVVTSTELIKAVKQVQELSAFAAVLRIGYTIEDSRIVLSYTNPTYLGNAYFRKDYPSVEQHFINFENKLTTALGSVESLRGEGFGSEEGFEAEDLWKYHYMFGMEYFDDIVELAEFDSFDAGKSAIDRGFAKSSVTRLVYAVEIPDENLKLYGVELMGEKGEAHFLPIIDIGDPRHTAFLPYEILLKGNQAVMMHGRFRIALSFPDLTMMTFGKIMSTPGDIEDMMKSITE